MLVTYLWLCWEYEARRWRTSWWDVALEIPSAPKVKETCSSTERCPIFSILPRNFSFERFSTFSSSSAMEESE